MFPFRNMQNLYEGERYTEKILYTPLSRPIWHKVFVQIGKTIVRSMRGHKWFKYSIVLTLWNVFY